MSCLYQGPWGLSPLSLAHGEVVGICPEACPGPFPAIGLKVTHGTSSELLEPACWHPPPSALPSPPSS